MKTAEKRVLIKGAGEHASGTAHRLFRSGLHVVMTEVECPRAVRRTVSFCTAVFDGQCQVEGVRAERYQLDNAEDLGAVKGDHIPVVVDPECRLREIWKPQVIIDGRILKENRGNSISDAPLVIGFGPGLVAGRDVHFVVETRRGHDLGRIISAGCAAPDTGVPGEIGGYTSERVLRAPTNGIIMSRRTIGDVVSGGDVVAVVGNAEVNTADWRGTARLGFTRIHGGGGSENRGY